MKSLQIFCACLALGLAACSKESRGPDAKTFLALNLQSGGSVSSATADDLYPQLVQPGNGTITLFFVSNRTTASGCSASAYCIFVSQSVTGYSDGNAALPRFTDPVALNVGGTAVTSTNAQGIAAFYDAAVPGYKVVYSDNTNAVKLATLPTANLSSGTLQAAATTETGPSGARSGVVNGAINLGGMFYVLGDGGATQKKIQAATAGDAGLQACAITDNCRWITYIRSAGANGLDFLHISTDGMLYRSSAGASRAAESFNKMLLKNGLKLTGLSSLGHGNSDLLLVSANQGGLNDLYVLNTPIKTAVTVAGNPPPPGVVGSVAAAVNGTIVSTTATRVYGQPNFTTANAGSTTSSTFNNPHDVSADATGLYVADQTNARVLFFPGTATVASRVYGQSGDLACGASYRQAGSCIAGAIGTQGNIGLSGNTPGVHVDSNGVYVTDIGSHRILFYAGTSTTPTRVYGQGGSLLAGTANNPALNADSLNNPQGVATDGSGVYIVDNVNNRVLFYPGTSTTATRVYGQGASGTSFGTNATGTSATALNGPRGVHVDATGVYVADTNNNRVVFYPGTSVTATRVYGQYDDLTCGAINRASGSCVGGTVTDRTLRSPLFVTGAGTHIYISDQQNHRVLHYTGTSTTADLVLGQNGSFTSATANNGSLGANGANALSSPLGVKMASDGLYVADYANQRILFYPPDVTAPVISAVAPATASSPSDAKVSYTLSETCASGSITWTRTGGNADGASPHVKALAGTELTQGTKTNITLTNNSTLVIGAIYSVAFNCTDAAGLAATTVTSTNVTIALPAQFHTFAGSAAGIEKGRGIAVTSDGGLAVVSTINADPGNFGGLTPLIAWPAAGTNLWVKKYSAAGVLEWHTLLGSGAIADAYTGIVKSSDGAIIVAGTSTTNVASLAGAGAPLSAFPGTSAFWTIKMTNAGAITWHTFGSQNDHTGTAGNPIVATNDGGAIVCAQGGVSSATLGGVTAVRANWISTWGDWHIIRYNANGSVNWHTHAGANDSNGAGATGCTFLQDGGVVAVGYVRSSSTGGTFFTQTPTPPAVLVEYGGPATSYSGYIIKFNSTGGVVWHTYTGSTNYSSSLDVIELADNSIIYSGYMDTTANGFAAAGAPIVSLQSGVNNTRFVKLSSTGTAQWITYAGTAGLTRMIKSSTGFYAVMQGTAAHNTGNGFPLNPLVAYSGDADIRVLSYNTSGTLLWHTYVGGAGVQNFTGGFVLGSSDEIYVTGDAVSGTTFGTQSPLSAHTAGGTSDTWVFKMPGNGVVP